MREILFRGKPVERFLTQMRITNQWDENGYVYGSLIVSDDRCYICTFAICYAKTITTNGIATMVEVIPETVGQFTGFKDCNRKMIYEQDIVYEGCNGFVGVVEWCDKLGTYRLKGLGEDYVIKDAEIEWEVIGNIHDNSELLKGQEK